MKYSLMVSSRFKRSFKRIKSNKNFKKSEFDKVINILLAGFVLEARYHNHKLSGEYAGFNECHVQNDILLIYKYIDDDLVLYALDLGTHTDLF